MLPNSLPKTQYSYSVHCQFVFSPRVFSAPPPGFVTPFPRRPLFIYWTCVRIRVVPALYARHAVNLQLSLPIFRYQIAMPSPIHLYLAEIRYISYDGSPRTDRHTPNIRYSSDMGALAAPPIRGPISPNPWDHRLEPPGSSLTAEQLR